MATPSGIVSLPGAKFRMARTPDETARSTTVCAAQFVTGVAEYDVSADGRKLLYRTGGGGGGRGGRGGGEAPAATAGLFLVDADRNPPQAGPGRVNASLRR